MPTNKTDDLHTLIHSLDASEKGHFTRFAQRHVLGEGNNYEKLFQVFAGMEEYDPEAVEREMHDLGIATPLPAAKNHLKSMVYKAMRDYHSTRNTHALLLDGLKTLDFLHQKKQYPLLRKEIRRLKKLAAMHSEHHILFKIGDYERKIHKETARREMIEGMERILAEMQNFAASFQNQLMYAHLMDKMLVIAIKSGPDLEAGVDALLSSDLLYSEEKARTTFSRIYYHQIYATAYYLKGHYQASQKEYEAVLRIWENAPHLIRDNPGGYRRILGNYLGICSMTGDYGHYEATLEKVRNSPCAQPSDEVEIFQIAQREELNWRMYNHDWEGVAAMMPTLQEGLARLGPMMSKSVVLAFQYQAATFYLLAEDYPNCKKWLFQITNAGRAEQRMDIQHLAQAIHLLLTWKQGELDLLEYEFRSVERYFETWGGGPLEEAVLGLTKGLLKATNRKEEKTRLEEFQERISATPQRDLTGAMMLRAWAMAQLTGIPAREALLILSGD